MENWLHRRADAMDTYLPTAPILSIAPGRVAKGTRIHVAEGVGQIYYSTDGDDPRSANGQVSPSARPFPGRDRISLLSLGVPATAFVPKASLADESWTRLGFDDSAWKKGKTAVGYDTATTYRGRIKLDLREAMFNANSSAYIRIHFDLKQDPASLAKLTLRMAYDDGFLAYLNGQKVAEANAPTKPAWNGAARDTGDDDDTLRPESFSLEEHRHVLRKGPNLNVIELAPGIFLLFRLVY